MSESTWQLDKRPTGIPGLDRLSLGGLPDGQATLVVGEAGTGKTVLALQILAHAIGEDHGGVFVTFEESPAQVRRNADSFRWGDALNRSDGWSCIDARNRPGARVAGEFDIEGLLAAVEVHARRFKRPWVVIDGIDQLLQHQPDRTLAVDQVRQINERCEHHGWPLLLSGKAEGHGLSPRHLEGIEFMLPTTLVLTATMIDRRLHRHIRIAKYRGSGHDPDQVPLIINANGIQLPYQAVPAGGPAEASTERISSGIERLDKLLDGGPYRGSSTLISGRPGTAKSTLAASFAEAAARRGERTLYVSFDELQAPYVRNLASVGIELQPHIDAGRIRFSARMALAGIIAEHMLALQNDIEEFEPHILIIDPVSALYAAGAGNGVQQIIALTRHCGITTIITSLTDEYDSEGEATSASVSTIADTWIVLDYNVRAGERNRSLSIVKSRGSGHSNQQRELLLSDQGVNLADVYEYGTEVLMGTARSHKESEDRAAERRRAIEGAQRRRDLERQIERAQDELERLRTELDLDKRHDDELDQTARAHAEKIKQRREPDAESATGDDPT